VYEVKESSCFFCSLPAERQLGLSGNLIFYTCPACGRYQVNEFSVSGLDKNIFTSFLYYNSHLPMKTNERIYCDIDESRHFLETEKEYPGCRRVTPEDAASWYPQNFSEKIDMILLGLAQLSEYSGAPIKLSVGQTVSMFFVNRYAKKGKTPWGNEEAKFNMEVQLQFVLKYMEEQKLIQNAGWIGNNKDIRLLPNGIQRIDELQKNQSSSRQVFIAMSFADEMKELREAVRQGIEKAGYTPRIMDEIEHNKQIVPEMLYEIRQSKFVVAELTGHNNGAYYEAGYAAGLGKEVIHICNEETFGKDGHFDVKQKASVLWKNIADVPELLCKRIEATI